MYSQKVLRIAVCAPDIYLLIDACDDIPARPDLLPKPVLQARAIPDAKCVMKRSGRLLRLQRGNVREPTEMWRADNFAANER